MFTLHFVLLIALCEFWIVPGETSVPANGYLNTGNGSIQEPASFKKEADTGLGSSNMPSAPILTQMSGKEGYEESSINEVEDDYNGEEFQDNRLRLMLQPKKTVTLNETALRTWKIDPDISGNSSKLVTTYRRSGATQLSEDSIENHSRTSKKETSSYDKNGKGPNTIRSKSEESLISLENKTEKTAEVIQEQRLNEKNLTIIEPKTDKTITQPQTQEKINLTEIKTSEGANSGNYAPAPPSSKNLSEIHNNDELLKNSNLTSFPKTDPQKISKVPNKFIEAGTAPKQEKESTKPVESANRDSRITDFQLASQTPKNVPDQNENNSENDNVYEELEPDILLDDNDIDYISTNESTVNEASTVVIVLSGSETKSTEQLPQTGVLPERPYISEAISQNLLHLLTNLTVMTAINEKNGKKILKELQEQKGQLQDLRKQSDSIYKYITSMNRLQQK